MPALRRLITQAMLSLVLLHTSFVSYANDDGSIKVLLLTGSANKYHNWQGSSQAIEQHLKDAHIFDVEKIITPKSAKVLTGFAPQWDKYQAVVLDYEGAEWPQATKAAFEQYIKNGGGLVTVHGANNTFPHWSEFNKIIGLGGWGGANLHAPALYPNTPAKHASRNEKWGPHLYWQNGQVVKSKAPGGTYHPPIHNFLMTVRTFDHPITRGLPEMWQQTGDEVYSRLRGPAENLTVLATGFANQGKPGASPHNEPLLFTVSYGQGRVVNSTLGHVGKNQTKHAPAVNNTSFVATLLRSVEWVATGEVTQLVPDNFPDAYTPSISAALSKNWINLLDDDLSQWDIFLGIPHSSVKGLPAGTMQSDDVTKGTPMGLNNDPKKVFSTYEKNEETILHITGEIYGGLTSKQSFENYHFQTKVRWGEKKWPPRLQLKRDSGIIYHAHGKHGAFWNTWKACLEFQVQEKDMGDFIPLAGPIAKAPYVTDEKGNSTYSIWRKYENFNGYLNARVEPDRPNGQWNTLDLYVVGDQAIHVVNGKIVMSLKDAIDKSGKPLTKGQIQIQSEAAEVEYKDIKIRPIEHFPELLRRKTKL